MATTDQEAIRMFMNITGVDEATAARNLEEHRGNLNEAVNAHFSEGDRHLSERAYMNTAGDDVMDIDDPVSFGMAHRMTAPLMPFGRDLNPFVLLDPTFPRNMFDGGNASNHPPFPREVRVRQMPIDARYVPDSSDNSVDDDTEHGPVTDDEENSPSPPLTPATGHGAGSSSMNSGPNSGIGIEREMIRAAIEASKQYVVVPNQDVRAAVPESDTELAHAVSLSLQTAEQEKAIRELEADSDEIGELPPNGRQSRLEVGSSSLQDVNRSLVRRQRRKRRVPSGSIGPVRNNTIIFESTPQRLDDVHRPQIIGRNFPSDVWGGISSEEHDEAVMLEAAMFGGIPEDQIIHNRINGSVGPYPYPRNVPRPPSPSLAAQRLIREQQNGEYLAALLADQEREMKAKEEAEAALAEELHREEVLSRKLHEEEENERQLAAKEASLPQEPTADDENAVTLLVRMPDGTRRGRRFLRTDKLQCLFDFIDVGRVVKPGSYRLVRPYPRRAFSDEESGSTLEELGLTSKQEALYLESI